MKAATLMDCSPSSNLPSVRTLFTATEDQIKIALCTIQSIYCPLRLPLGATVKRNFPSDITSGTATPILADSGYASGDDLDDEQDAEDTLATVRADVYERNFTVRWLTCLIARAEEIPFESEENRERIIEDAALILASFSESPDNEVVQALTRDFSFPLFNADASKSTGSINVQLNDAPLSDTDHTGVGLQSWGASIVLSSLMCAGPSQFGLDILPPNTTIIDLGAGTGLVSLVLAKLLPSLIPGSSSHPSEDHFKYHILATDYHPAVLENLRANITTNCPSQSTTLVKAMLLDWSAPIPLASPATMLIAADVVYAPEHANLLRDCAAQLLSPTGTFWLIVTLRTTGKFEGVLGTVEDAFTGEKGLKRDGKSLKVLGKERVEKRRGVGRGDERGYDLYRIGWA